MSVFATLFGNKPAQATPPAAPQGQPGQQAAASPHVQANNQVPNSTNTPVQQPTPENPQPQSPNSEFSDLWSTASQQQNDQSPNFQFDPAKFQQHLSQVDFTKNIKRENVEKIMAGGEEAVGALMSVLNDFGREVFSNNAKLSANLAENSYSHATQSMQRGLPDLVTKQLSRQELLQANPKLRDPALQPMVQAIQSQLQQKHPNATPAELNGMVNKYFNEHVMPAFAPAQEQNTQAKSNDSSDFSSFLGA